MCNRFSHYSPPEYPFWSLPLRLCLWIGIGGPCALMLTDAKATKEEFIFKVYFLFNIILFEELKKEIKIF